MYLLTEGKVDIPSFQVSVGDEIGVREKNSSRQVATRNLEGSQYHPPAWVGKCRAPCKELFLDFQSLTNSIRASTYSWWSNSTSR